VGDNFWESIRKHFEDLAIALVIVLKEILFAFAVFGGGHALSWAVRHWSGSGEHIGEAISIISDVGSVLLFVVLVSKDLKEYFKNR
jgi:predicted small integral membrane protein